MAGPSQAAVRSALAPRSRTLLEQAVRPDEDDARERAIADIIEGRKELLERRKVYDEADEYYDGDLGMVFASERVRRILSRQGVEDIHDFNYAAIPVDRIAARLQVSSVVAAPADENDAAEARDEDAAAVAANKVIAKLRKVNESDAEEKRLLKLACKYGESYYLVWPGIDEDGKPTVDMRVNSPYNVVMVYDEEDQLRARYVLKSWEREIESGKIVTRANLYYPDHIERWTTEAGGNPEKEEAWFKLVAIDDEDSGEDGDFGDLDDDDRAAVAADEFTDERDVETGEAELDLGDVANPWGRVPWFHFRNDRPPRPEHANAYGPQQLINKLIWGLAGTIDYTTFPQRYLLMDPMVDDPMANLNDSGHPDIDDDDPETDSGDAGLSADPGSVWKLWGKNVGQFDPAEISGFLNSLTQIVGSMGDLTGLPQYLFNRKSSEIPSGESYREANADFIAIIGDRQDRYDPTLQDAYEFALKMLGVTNVSVDVRWKPAQMVNDLAGWQVIQAKIGAGVPPKVALEEAGYAAEQVDEWLKDATGADLGRRIALLNQIGTAVQTMGAGIAMGAVSAEQMQAVVSAILIDALAGSGHDIPEAKEFVDPQAALKAQQDMQDKQLQHAGATQDKQLDHATTTQQTAQEHAAQMAEAAHQRMKETMAEGGTAPGQPPGRGPGGRRGPTPAKKAAKKAAPRKPGAQGGGR